MDRACSSCPHMLAACADVTHTQMIKTNTFVCMSSVRRVIASAEHCKQNSNATVRSPAEAMVMTWSSFVHLSTVWSMRGSSCTHAKVGVNIHSVCARPQTGLAPRRDDVTDSTRAESLGTDAGSGPEQSLLSRRRRVYAPVVLHGRTRREARTGYARAGEGLRCCGATAGTGREQREGRREFAPTRRCRCSWRHCR